ncbi:MAG TPA: FIST N-terminal domain-containing protein, partial [Leptospiraceae bacterium]|nr:FIST N-terminal domain-containing protein [Leptospiraceae bacterium]
MKTEQKRWTESEGWEDIIRGNGIAENAQLVFVFGGRNVLENSKLTDQISSWYPNAGRIFASTAGEITDTEVTDDGLAVTAVYFEKSKVEFASAKVENANDSFKAGEELSRILNSKGKLRHVIIISEGLKVNGTELVKGISSNLPPGVTVTGGLAGDGAKFEVTTVGLNKSPESGILAAVGLYGDSLKIGFGSQGGWSAFGDTLKITKSKANVLYELNGNSALSIYKNYLGE